MCCVAATCCSQPSRSMNAVYFEALGSSAPYSINYDRIVMADFGLRIGYCRYTTGGVSVASIPLMLNYLVGEENSHVEIGAGVLHMAGSADFGAFSQTGQTKTSFDLVTTAIGYRYQPVNGGFLFRVDLTPVFGFRRIIPMGGISVGAAF